MNISNPLIQVFNSIQLNHSENVFLQTLLYPVTPIVKMVYQLSIIIISYPNLWFNLYSLKFFVPISSSFRSRSHHTALCKFHASPFLTKYILLIICLVCLVSLTLSAIHKSDLLSNIIKCACSGTTNIIFSKTYYLASWSFLEPFLQCMLHCTSFWDYYEKLCLEHMRNNQLVHFDKTQYMLLCFCQYLDSFVRWNQSAPPVDSQL